MTLKIATAVLLSLAFAPQQRGWVSTVTAADGNAAGAVQFTIRGNNPCGAVNLDVGDGTAITHAISQLPVTLTHTYTKAGEYTVRARGQGNCDGDIFTRVNVTRVGGIFGRGSAPNMRFAEMDQNRDGVITRAEWRGTANEFGLNDWNNDGRLSGDEVRLGANSENRFANMDQNRDGVITRAEWRGTAQAFDEADWNNDGRLSGDEVREGAERQWDWTEAQFRRFDRNRDNFLSGTEWRYDADDFLQVDRNRDDRVSLSEFLDGDNARRAGNAGRGRGWGRGRGNQDSRDPSVTVRVTNNVAWTDTGLDVRAGDRLDVDASGTIQFSPRAADTTGPEGAQGHRATARAPMPNQLIGALIARVGNSGPFLVGANRNNLRAPQTGRLYLGVNDDNLRDNRGEFRVIVSVNRQ